ncbi:hypothetical protein BE17_04065 [Sorangium cellulosum]|uniref:Disintegrin domain-containing protein n=1 Tax=Sorangium cellulosum TaxID=56 RepID=A0A150RW07_SORCE|nr:hypothetical protein BE17_04065 [Sorangium cellulosum]
MTSAACERDEQCLSGFCVDGTCCNQACRGQCQACDTPGNVGFCTTLGSQASPEPPHLNTGGTFERSACRGDGTACSGVCDGTNPVECTYPGPTSELGAPTCSCPDEGCAIGPGEELHRLCDGNGGSTEDPRSCGGARCADGNTCKTSCDPALGDADCILDFICEEGACVELNTPRCDGKHTVRVPAADDIDCTPYACDGSACLERCASVSDCVSPSVCNTAGECVPQFELPDPASCSCRTVGEPPNDSAPLGVLLLGLGAAGGAVARRRPRRATAGR